MRSLVVVLVGFIILSFCSFSGYAQEKQDEKAGPQQQVSPAPAAPATPAARPGGPCDGREHDR